jgi:protein-S-isoprenylcysteine O-methyltransferase Ste14
MKIRLKVNGFIIFLATLLTIIFPGVIIRHSSSGLFDEATEVFGIAFILFGQIIRVSARGYKAQHSSGGRSLIQGGPYVLARNPMYLGILLIGLGFVMMTLEWWAAVIFIAIFALRYIFLMFEEEKKLLSQFSQEYRDYCKKIPRFFPTRNTVMNADIFELLPLRIAWLKKEIGTIVAVLFGALFIESWEDIRTKGWGEYYKESIILAAVMILFALLFVYLSVITESKRNGASNKS